MNLYEKISEVMQEVAYLAKDDKVETGGGKSYKAISEEKVTSSIRAALIKNSIVILPIKQQHIRQDEDVVDKYGNKKVNRFTTVDVTYRIINAQKPEEFIEVQSSGTGVDTQDKGVGKAMTYAYKYMLLRTFAIPTGDDADKISSDLYNDQLYGGKQQEKQETIKNVPMATVTQQALITAKTKQLGHTLQALLKRQNVATLSEITEIRAEEIIQQLDELLAANGTEI